MVKSFKFYGWCKLKRTFPVVLNKLKSVFSEIELFSTFFKIGKNDGRKKILIL